MIIVKYRNRIFIDGWRCRDVMEITKFHKVEIHGGLLYGWRSKFAVQTIEKEMIDDIEDTETGALVDVEASFKAQELAYDLPF